MTLNILKLTLIFLFPVLASAQEATADYKPGDVFIVGDKKYNNYKHIDFPRPNFIIKKGGIVNYRNIKGEKVVINSVDEKSDGTILATIKLAESRKFFNSHKFVNADISKALKNEELVKVEN